MQWPISGDWSVLIRRLSDGVPFVTTVMSHLQGTQRELMTSVEGRLFVS